MNEETKALAVSGGTEAGPAPVSPRKVDLGRILNRDHDAALRRLSRTLRTPFDDHLVGHRAVVEKAMSRNFACPGARGLAQNERARFNNSVQNHLAPAVEPDIAPSKIPHADAPLANQPGEGNHNLTTKGIVCVNAVAHKGRGGMLAIETTSLLPWREKDRMRGSAG